MKYLNSTYEVCCIKYVVMGPLFCVLVQDIPMGAVSSCSRFKGGVSITFTVWIDRGGSGSSPGILGDTL